MCQYPLIKDHKMTLDLRVDPPKKCHMVYSPFCFHLTGRVANLLIILTAPNGLSTAVYRYANLKVAPQCQMKTIGLYPSVMIINHPRMLHEDGILM